MSDAGRVSGYQSDEDALVGECAKYGLPTSLRALLRHVYNNRDATLGAKQSSIDELLSQAAMVTEYTIDHGPDGAMPLAVKLRDPEKDRWAVVCMGRVLNARGEWEWEPQPSSRSDEFLERTRYGRYEAIRRAREAKHPYEHYREVPS